MSIATGPACRATHVRAVRIKILADFGFSAAVITVANGTVIGEVPPRLARASGVDAKGFGALGPAAGTERLRAVLATQVSTTDGLSRAVKPRPIIPHPDATAPATPAAMIDGRRVRFLMSFPLLGACTHLEWDVDLAHRSVDSAGLRRSFQAVREQVGLQRK